MPAEDTNTRSGSLNRSAATAVFGGWPGNFALGTAF
ncbi:hypothetical protein FBY34_5157 [Streptomyces sp. SLBN-115]|nr:hypothetical protein FBY34_5157 [Streptomyces sp. SLBN-115]